MVVTGSQLGEPDEMGGPEAGKAGITIRIYAQRLWVLSVAIEHGIMLMRIAIMKLAPETPTWCAGRQPGS